MEYKKFTKTIQVNGHTVEAEVKIEVQEDDASLLLDQDFESEATKEEYIKRIESGVVFAGFILVEARALGCVGSDSIGCVELKPNNAFNSAPFEESVNQAIQDHDLIIVALNELKLSIQAEAVKCEQKAKLAVERANKFRKYSRTTGAK